MDIRGGYWVDIRGDWREESERDLWAHAHRDCLAYPWRGCDGDSLSDSHHEVQKNSGGDSDEHLRRDSEGDTNRDLQLCAILSAKWSVDSAGGGKDTTGHGVS